MIVEIIIVYKWQGTICTRSFVTEAELLKYIEKNNDINIIRKTIVDL